MSFSLPRRAPAGSAPGVLSVALALLIAAGPTACSMSGPSPTVVGPAAPPPAEDGLDVLATMQATPRLATFSRLAVAAGLEPNLRRDGQWTVFAPTDEAFERLPQGALDALIAPEGRESLRALVMNHLVEGLETSSELRKRAELETIGGGSLDLVSEGGELRIEGGRLLTVDVEADNGVVHVIDVVLAPRVAPGP